MASTPTPSSPTKSTLRNVLIGCGGIIIAGFICVVMLSIAGHTNPPVTREPEWDSLQTRELAQRACFDCHSNETVWPWYSYVPPISFGVIFHVQNGRRHLNFSEWDTTAGRAAGDYGDIAEIIREGGMPMPQYLALHPEADLTSAEQQQLIDGLRETIRNDPPSRQGGGGEWEIEFDDDRLEFDDGDEKDDEREVEDEEDEEDDCGEDDVDDDDEDDVCDDNLFDVNLPVETLPINTGDKREVYATVAHIAPQAYSIQLHYDPQNPATIAEWQARTGAALVINAGFFKPDYQSSGLLITPEGTYGTPFDQVERPALQYSGMFSITGGQLRLRALARSPYVPGEPLDQAVQGLPMLLEAGEPLPFSLPERRARRTVIGLDQTGQLVLVVIDQQALTLLELQHWLAETSELALSEALNLDGGPSTGLVLKTLRQTITIDSQWPVSSILAFYPED